MAYNDSKDYFIKITPEFLFDEYDVFISEYSPWVYLLLKFKFNYYLKKAPDKKFRIPTDDIVSYFGVDRSTVSRAVKELAQKGFLEKCGKLFKIKDESIYKEKFKSESVATKKYLDFIKVYYEHLDRMEWRFKQRIPDKYKSKKFFLKLLETNYYLKSKNRHCLIDEKMVASEECVNSICKALNYDNRTARDILNVLEDAGYIKLGTDTKITTIDIYAKQEEKKIVEPFVSNESVTDVWKEESERIIQNQAEPKEEFYYKTKHEYVPEMNAYKEVKIKVKGKAPANYRPGGFIYENYDDEFSEYDERFNFNDKYDFCNN